MTRDKKPSAGRIDLGAASLKTRGAVGPMTDFVRYMEHWGISHD